MANLTVNEERLARAMLARSLGMSFDGQRDIYASCGYKKELLFEDYFTAYERNGIAATVVEAMPDSSWRAHPFVYETEKEKVSTEFEKKWDQLTTSSDLELWETLHRVDALSGIGRYAVILLGIADGLGMETPLKGKNNELSYLQVYTEASAEIIEWEADPKNKRFGRPLKYQIKLDDMQGGIGKVSPTPSTIVVHHSRVIHVPSDRVVGNRSFGTPRMKRSFNWVADIEKIAAAGAEGWWLSAFQGLQFDIRDDAELSPKDRERMDEEINSYVHNLQRYLRTEGVDVKPITATAADPKGIIDVLFQCIAASTRIPMRILTGSEQGELAGEKDDENWKARVGERKRRQCEAKILRPLVVRLIECGVLPKTKDVNAAKEPVFITDWDDESEMTAMEQAELGKAQVDTVATYIAGNVEAIWPLEQFLADVLRKNPEEIAAIIKEMEQDAKEREEEEAAAGEEEEEGEEGEEGLTQ